MRSWVQKPLGATLVAVAIAAGGIGGYYVAQDGGGGGGACEWPSCFPDASNTGPDGTALTPTSAFSTTSNNQVIENIEVTDGCIEVNGETGVTIRNSEIQCVVATGATVNPANAPLTVEDTIIDCNYPGKGGDPEAPLAAGPSRGIDAAANIEVYRVEITRCSDGIMLSDGYVHVEDSWMHTYTQCANADCENPTTGNDDDVHTDGIQAQDGASDHTYLHNNINITNLPCGVSDGSCTGTSALQLCSNSGCNTVDNLTVRNNLLVGGSSVLACPVVSTTNSDIGDNSFSSHQVPPFEYSFNCADDDTGGNIVFETGDPLALD